jgi:hypothetical protein
MMAAVETMTQEQINVCAWCMGADGVGWSKSHLLSKLQQELDRKANIVQIYIEAMG